jgi:hypothetical protein
LEFKKNYVDVGEEKIFLDKDFFEVFRDCWLETLSYYEDYDKILRFFRYFQVNPPEIDGERKDLINCLCTPQEIRQFTDIVGKEKWTRKIILFRATSEGRSTGFTWTSDVNLAHKKAAMYGEEGKKAVIEAVFHVEAIIAAFSISQNKIGEHFIAHPYDIISQKTIPAVHCAEHNEFFEKEDPLFEYEKERFSVYRQHALNSRFAYIEQMRTSFPRLIRNELAEGTGLSDPFVTHVYNELRPNLLRLAILGFNKKLTYIFDQLGVCPTFKKEKVCANR